MTDSSIRFPLLVGHTYILILFTNWFTLRRWFNVWFGRPRIFPLVGDLSISSAYGDQITSFVAISLISCFLECSLQLHRKSWHIPRTPCSYMFAADCTTGLRYCSRKSASSLSWNTSINPWITSETGPLERNWMSCSLDSIFHVSKTYQHYPKVTKNIA